MISEMEVEWLKRLAESLQDEGDSDRVREGKALAALIEAHDALKAPHLANLHARESDSERNSQLEAVAATLDAAVASTAITQYPLQTHLEALKGAATTASNTLRGIIAAS